MKIVCDNCATKYSIADDKVRGKVFKIRCKKCSHVIVVRGNEAGDAEPATDASAFAADNEEAATIAQAPGPLPAAESGGEAVWHLVVDREQVGPLTPDEVRAKFAAGQVDAETYAWREGFGDWVRLGSIEDFKELAPKPVAAEARTMIAAELPPEVAALAAKAALPAPAKETADPFAAAQSRDNGAKSPSPFGGGDLFDSAGPTQAASSPAASMFGAAEPAKESPASSSLASFASIGDEPKADGPKMTGQRNENSVLFSLNNLQALATGGGASSAPAPAAKAGYADSKGEGSGLIDIRAMAQRTLSAAPTSSSGASSDLPPLSAEPVFSSVVAAPIMMPAQQAETPKWIWGVIGGGAAAVIAAVVVVVVVVTKKPEPAPLMAMNIPAPAVAPPAAPVAAQPGAAPAAPAPAAEAAKPAEGEKVAAEKVDPKRSSSRGSHGEAKPAAAKSERPAAAPGVAPKKEEAAAAKEEKKPAKKGDELDDLLDGATGGKASPKPAAAKEEPAAADENLPEQLERGDIIAGMKSLEPKIHSCFEQYKVPGMALTKVVIGKNGRVASATVGGALSGTPSGDCVSKAAKSASFKKFKGAAMNIDWPFMLK